MWGAGVNLLISREETFAFEPCGAAPPDGGGAAACGSRTVGRLPACSRARARARALMAGGKIDPWVAARGALAGGLALFSKLAGAAKGAGAAGGAAKLKATAALAASGAAAVAATARAGLAGAEK